MNPLWKAARRRPWPAFSFIRWLTFIPFLPPLVAEHVAGSSANVFKFAAGSGPEEVVLTFYVYEGQGGSPTEITRVFLQEIARELEVGVKEKSGALKVKLLANRARLLNKTDELFEPYQEVIKLSMKGVEGFWKKTLNLKELKFTRTFTLDPPPGETRTVRVAPCYTRDELKRLMDAQVKGAEMFIEAVNAAKKEIEAERAAKAVGQ